MSTRIASNLVTKRCPACGDGPIEPIKGNWGLGKPTFHCTKCRAQLGTSVWPGFLWLIPALLVVIPVTNWLSNLLAGLTEGGGAVPDFVQELPKVAAGLALAYVLARGVRFTIWANRDKETP